MTAGGRRGISACFRALVQWKVAIAFSLLGAWIVCEVVVGQWLTLWNTSLTTDTVIWGVTVASVLLVNMAAVGREKHYLRKQVIAAMTLPVIIAGLLNLFVPGLVVELVLQPVLFSLGAMSIVLQSESHPEQVKKFINALLALIWLALVAYAVLKGASLWPHLDKHELVLQLALSLWLSLAVLPFVYLVGLYGTYESAFVMIDLNTQAPLRVRLARRVALLVSFQFKAHEFHEFIKQRQWTVSEATSVREVRRLVREYRAARLEEAERELAPQSPAAPSGRHSP